MSPGRRRPAIPAVPVPATVVIVSLPETLIAAGATIAPPNASSSPIRINDLMPPPPDSLHLLLSRGLESVKNADSA